MVETNLLTCLAQHPNDPCGYYEAVRNAGGKYGVFRDNILDAWVVTSYKACVKLLNSSSLIRSRLELPATLPKDLLAIAESVLGAQLMFRDDQAAITRRKWWAKRLKQPCDVCLKEIASLSLEPLESRLKLDLYSKVLRPYASRVVAYRLGIREEARLAMLPMVEQVVNLLDGRLTNDQQMTTAMASVADLYSQLSPHVSIPMPVEYDGDRHGWLADLLLVLVAGHDSAAFLLASALCNRPQNETSAIALLRETSRYDSPVQLVGRKAVELLTIQQTEISPGELVYLHLGAANRDPMVFDEPDAFRIGRSAGAIAFGNGPSACLGSSVAMRSATLMLEELIVRDIQVDPSQIVWRNGLAGRGLAHLPITRTLETKVSE